MKRGQKRRIQTDMSKTERYLPGYCQKNIRNTKQKAVIILQAQFGIKQVGRFRIIRHTNAVNWQEYVLKRTEEGKSQEKNIKFPNTFKGNRNANKPLEIVVTCIMHKGVRWEWVCLLDAV